jgi:hypothetical protein
LLRLDIHLTKPSRIVRGAITRFKDAFVCWPANSEMGRARYEADIIGER